MPNPIERWLLRKEEQTRASSSMDGITSLLRGLLPECAACANSLNGHDYRFFSMHPADGSLAAASFRSEVERGNWIAVHLNQMPAVRQAIYVVYVIACSSGGGMAALLLADATGPHRLLLNCALSRVEFAKLRALCPSCRWISFSPSQETEDEVS